MAPAGWVGWSGARRPSSGRRFGSTAPGRQGRQRRWIMTSNLKLGWVLSRTIGPNGAVARTLVMRWSHDTTADRATADRRHTGLDNTPAPSRTLFLVSRPDFSHAGERRRNGLPPGFSR